MIPAMTCSPTTVFAKRLRVGDPFKVRSADVLATKRALGRPWARVPELLGWGSGNLGRSSIVAPELDVPSWQAHFLAVLQCEDTLCRLDKCDVDQHHGRSAQLAVARVHVRHRRNLVAGRSRKLLGIAGPLSRSPQSGATGQTAVAAPVRRSAEGS